MHFEIAPWWGEGTLHPMVLRKVLQKYRGKGNKERIALAFGNLVLIHLLIFGQIGIVYGPALLVLPPPHIPIFSRRQKFELKQILVKKKIVMNLIK